jgi:hypothetical protein
MIAGYYKLVALPDEVKAQNKIRSKARLDCIASAGNYKGLTNFVNKQGQMFFYKTPCREFIGVQTKRVAEWSLTNSSINFSSIYIEDFDFLEYGYGYPNAKPRLSNGEPNPLLPFKNDGYLFIVNKDYTEIEILILPDGRNLINHYYQQLIDGYFDAEIQKLRAEAKPCFNYMNFESA